VGGAGGDLALAMRQAGWDPEAPHEVAAFRALRAWLSPPEEVQARPESEYVTLAMSRANLAKRGAFSVPKVDVDQERVWPPPDVKLPSGPASKQSAAAWNRARGYVWRKLLRLLPEEDPTRGWRWETCAVVGNGGSLLLEPKGREISAHDAVFRFNRGVRRGFEAFAGNRTTVRIVNRNHLGFMEDGDGAVLQQVTSPEAFEAFVNLTASRPPVPVYGIDSEFHALVLDRYRKLLEGISADLQSILGWRYQGEKLKWDSPATNGFYGVTLALQRCRRVSIYGFARSWGQPSLSSPALKLRYHYFDAQEPIRAQQARDNDEFMGLASLVRVLRQRVRFGEPCIAMCSGKMIDSARDPGVCPQCPPGGWCACNAWHPVPRPGHCFFPHTAITCFHKCQSSAVCPGGVRGICPPDASLYEPRCKPARRRSRRS